VVPRSRSKTTPATAPAISPKKSTKRRFPIWDLFIKQAPLLSFLTRILLLNGLSRGMGRKFSGFVFSLMAPYPAIRSNLSPLRKDFRYYPGRGGILKKDDFCLLSIYLSHSFHINFLKEKLTKKFYTHKKENRVRPPNLK